MTRPVQKEMERWILNRFLQSLGEATPGQPSSFMANEGPDFLMGTAVPCSLGIEIVELYHVHTGGSGLLFQQEEGIYEHLCRIIKLRWDTSNMPVAEVSLHLLGHQLPKKQDEIRLADSILSLVRANMPKEECVSKITRDDLWQHPILGHHIHSLTIARWSGLNHPYVTAPRATFLPPLSHELLQAAFTKKTKKSLSTESDARRSG